MKSWLFLVFMMVAQLAFCQQVYNIMSYGAVPDSTTNNSQAIQKAIDACFRLGGGTVYVPPGKFMTGSITLKSNIHLYLESGAVLLGSPRVADYPSFGLMSEQRDNALIVGLDATNITISGQGTIDGNGRRYVLREPHFNADFDRRFIRQGAAYMPDGRLYPDGPWKMKPRPGVLIALIHCTNVSLTDINVVDAPNWCIHLGACRYVGIRGLTMLNSLFIPNADCIDASNCQFVTISDCNLVCGDDGIAISPCADGWCSGPSEAYTVSNCNITSRSSGIRIGYGSNLIRNLVFQNINIIESNRGIGLYVRGSQQNISDISFSNVIIKSRLFDGTWWGCGDPIQLSVIPMAGGDTTLGTIKNIRFSNIIAEGENGITVYGATGGHISNIVFNSLSLHIKSSSMTQTCGGNLDLRPVADRRYAIFRHNVSGLLLHNADHVTCSDIRLSWANGLPAYFTNGIQVEKSKLLLGGFSGGPAPNATGAKAVTSDNESVVENYH